MGVFDVFKKTRRDVVRANQSQGRDGEEKVKRDYEFSGYKVERTGKGHDFKATKRDWLTGKKEVKHIEVKTGGSKLSKLQKKKKRQFGKKYVVERLEQTPFGLTHKSNMFGGSPTRKEKTKKKSSSKYDALLGSGGSKKRKSSGFW